MSLDFKSNAGVEAWAALWMAAAKANIEKEGKLPPVASVVVTAHVEDGELVFLAADSPFTPEAKDKWLNEIRAALADKAIAVITAGEAMMWDDADGQEVEAVVIDLEHSTLGNHVWVANIIRGDAGVKLTPFQERNCKSRFGSLLKK